MGSVLTPMSVSPSHPVSLVVTLRLDSRPPLDPGAPLDAAVRLADALDARRVPLTLLAGARPHPEVVAWVAARRRAGDAVLLHGTGSACHAEHHCSWRRLPRHEAGLRLVGALRARDGVGLEVDGFAAPGWVVSDGVRAALVSAGVDLVVDDSGVHRLGDGGTTRASVPGPVVGSHGSTGPGASRWTRRSRRRPATALRHRALTTAERSVDDVLGAVDADLAAGAVPDTAPGLLTPRRPARRTGGLGDPESWSITA